MQQFFTNLGVYLEITGTKDAPREEQLLYFHQEFRALFKSEGKSAPPKNWIEAFDRLQKEVQTIPILQKVILFLMSFLGLPEQSQGFCLRLNIFGIDMLLVCPM